MATADDSMDDDVFETQEDIDNKLKLLENHHIDRKANTPSPTGYRGYQPPAEVLKLCRSNILNEDEVVIHKTILLGDSGVGKTSLLVKFDTGRFESGKFSATVGIGFTIMSVLKFCKEHSLAKTPTRTTSNSAGFDLYSVEYCIVEPRSRALVNIGIKLELPPETYGRIAPRSGLSLNYGIDIGAGVIDQDYRGVIKVLVFNHSGDQFIINPGDRIAQLICERICCPILEESSSLDFTLRGSSGFGSSGWIDCSKKHISTGVPSKKRIGSTYHAFDESIENYKDNDKNGERLHN